MYRIQIQIKRIFFLFFFFWGLSVASSPASAVTLSVSCGPDPGYAGPCQLLAEDWAKQTGNKINMFYLPGEANDQLAIYQQLFSAKHAVPDVIRVDVIWPGLLHKHLADLKKYIPDTHIKLHDSSLRDSLEVKEKLVAIPFYNETGILYYRKDLLKKYNKPVPGTWKELTETAAFIMKKERRYNPDMTGFVWDGRPYEGLTCDALEWIASYGGGKIIEDNGSISVNNPNAVMALEMAASWVGSITPKEILFKSVSSMFTSGNAVFRRGWSGGLGVKPWWSKGRSVIAGKVGVAPLPGYKPGLNFGTIGTENLGINIYSKHKKEAADLVRYLTGKKAQIQLAKTASYNPSIPLLYKHPDILKALPYLNSSTFQQLKPIARPSIISGVRYNKVTKKIWEAVHKVISGKISAKQSIQQLEKDLQKIKGNGWPK